MRIRKTEESPSLPKQCKQTSAQAVDGPRERPLATDSPAPPAFHGGGFLCLWFVLGILTRVSNRLLDVSIRMETPQTPQVKARLSPDL